MPFIDIQSRLGINLDQWLLLQSSEQPHKRAARCHAFEKEFLECAHGIGQTRAKTECKLEMEDFYECMHRTKLQKKLYDIRQQRIKMEKEKTYVTPAHHAGAPDNRP